MRVVVGRRAPVPRRPSRRAALLGGAAALLVVVPGTALVVGGGPAATAGPPVPAGWQAAYEHADDAGTRAVRVQSVAGAVRLEVADASGTAVVLRRADGSGWTCGTPVGSSTTCTDAGAAAEPAPPEVLERLVVAAGAELDADGCGDGGRWCYDDEGRLLRSADPGAGRLSRVGVGPLAAVDDTRPGG